MCIYKHLRLWNLIQHSILFYRISKSMIMWYSNAINNPILLKLMLNNEFGICWIYSTNIFMTHTHVKSNLYNSRNIHIHQIANCKEINNKSKEKPRVYKTRKIKFDVQNYLQSVNPKFLEICPKESLTISNIGKNTLYLVDPNVAKKFTELIADDLLKNESLVVEANPGMGILTVELLKRGIPFINVFETNKCFYSSLYEIKSKYPGRIRLHKIPLFSIQKITSKLSEGLRLTDYADNQAIHIIGCTTGRFLRVIPNGILYPDSILLNRKVTFYLAVSPIEWKVLTCKFTERHYSKLSILFQTLCNYKVIGALDRQALIPWQRFSAWSKNDKDINENDLKELYVVKIQARHKYLEEHFKSEDLQVFFQFVQKYLTAKSSRIIPSLEKWIPGCGPRLIARGYNIFTTFGELEPNEVMELFREITTWPGYNTSTKYIMNPINGLENENKLFLDKHNPGL